MNQTPDNSNTNDAQPVGANAVRMAFVDAFQEPTVEGADKVRYPLSSGSLDSVGTPNIFPKSSPLPDAKQEGPFLDAAVASLKEVSAPFLTGRYAAVMSSLSPDEKEPYFNPFDGLEPKYQQYGSIISHAQSSFDLMKIKEYIDDVQAEKETASSNQAANVLGTLVGGALDPSLLAGGLFVDHLLPSATSLSGVLGRGAAVGAGFDLPLEAARSQADPDYKMKDMWTGIILSALGNSAFTGALHGLGRGIDYASAGLSGGEVGPVDQVSEPLAKAIAQPIEDVFDIKPRWTPSGDLKPEEYLAQMKDEGLAEPTGLFKYPFKLFTSTLGGDKGLANWQPSIVARLLTSDSLVVRQLTNDLAEHNFLLGGTESGRTIEPSIESVVDERTFKNVGRLEDIYNDGYADYRKAGGQLDYMAFKDRVTRASWQFGEDADPTISKAASQYNSLMDEYFNRYKEVDAFKQDFELPTKGEHYFTRSIDPEKIINDADGWRQLIYSKLDSAMSDPDKLKAYNEITTNALGAHYFDINNLKWTDSNLKSRTLHFSNQELASYLNTDGEQIGKAYITRAERSIALMERFGTTNKEKIFAPIDEDYQNLRNTTNDPKELHRLMDRREQDLNNLGMLYDRLMGTRGRPKDPGSTSATIVRNTLNFNNGRLLGSSGISQFSDAGRSILARFSEAQLEDTYRNLGISLDKIAMSPTELKQLGAMVSHQQGIMHILQGEPVMHDEIVKNGLFSTALKTGSDASMSLSMMQSIDNASRSMASVTAARQINVLSHALVEGTLRPQDQVILARLGIDKNMAKSILTKWDKHAETIDGVTYPNTHLWTGPAGDTMRAAIHKTYNANMIRPGIGDKFGFADANGIGRVLMQYRGYMQGAWSRILLPGMQRGDARFLGQLAGIISLGYLQAYLKFRLSGYDTTGVNWTEEALDKSGAVPYLFDMYATGSNAFFGGGVQRQKIQGRLDTLLGPSAGLVSKGIPAVMRLVDGSTRPGDVQTLKSLIPMNNLIWWNWKLTRLAREKSAELKAQQEQPRKGAKAL